MFIGFAMQPLRTVQLGRDVARVLPLAIRQDIPQTPAAVWS
jgi:hypothetical protein